ncbi:hypothetical protein HAX54_032697, partial [Datura stramonium]|nr:hypothetical protein [Datura stramonium]
ESKGRAKDSNVGKMSHAVPIKIDNSVKEVGETPDTLAVYATSEQQEQGHEEE